MQKVVGVPREITPIIFSDFRLFYYLVLTQLLSTLLLFRAIYRIATIYVLNFSVIFECIDFLLMMSMMY